MKMKRQPSSAEDGIGDDSFLDIVANIVGILTERNVDVVVNYLPVGSENATKWYVEQILNAGCGMVNCIPVFLAREDYWRRRFEEKALPIIGDDIKSQVGATILHRVLTRLFEDRGATYLPSPTTP